MIPDEIANFRFLSVMRTQSSDNNAVVAAAISNSIARVIIAR